MSDNSRAVRDNNPGNLMTGGRIIYAGQTGEDSDGYATFATWDAGVRAADLNLQSYAKRGVDTPSEIAHTWSTTDQDAYTTNLANALGVTPNTPLNLTDPNVRNTVLGAIFHQEDSQYNASSTPLSSMWSDIQSAAATGNPLTLPFAIGGVLAKTIGPITSGAVNNIAGPGTTIGNALHFDLGSWLQNQATGAAKQYLLPIAVGLGAILLIMISAWGLVKDSPVGGAIKTSARVGTGALFV